MATRHINDYQVCAAVFEARFSRLIIWPDDILGSRYGQCSKVCYRAMERAINRGYLEYGVSLRGAWLTDKGFELLGE